MIHTTGLTLLLALSSSLPHITALTENLVDEGSICEGVYVNLQPPPLYNESFGLVDFEADEVPFDNTGLGRAFIAAMSNESMPFDFDCDLPECFEDGMLPGSTVVELEGGEGTGTPDAQPVPNKPGTGTPGTGTPGTGTPGTGTPGHECYVEIPETPETPETPGGPDTPDTPDSPDTPDVPPNNPICRRTHRRSAPHSNSNSPVKRIIAKRTVEYPHSDFQGAFITFPNATTPEFSNGKVIYKRNRIGNFGTPSGIIGRWKRGTTLKYAVRTCNCGSKVRGQRLSTAVNMAVGEWENINRSYRTVNGRSTSVTANIINFQRVDESFNGAVDFLVRCDTEEARTSSGGLLNGRAFFPNDKSRNTVDIFPRGFLSYRGDKEGSLDTLSKIVAHELGHILGLAHEAIDLTTSIQPTTPPDDLPNNPNSIMGQSETRTVNANDLASLRKLMGFPAGKVIQGHAIKEYASRRKSSPKNIMPTDLLSEKCKAPPPGGGENCYTQSSRVCMSNTRREL